MAIQKKKSQLIYLDHNATTKVSELVKSQIPGLIDLWGNPSSVHWAGRKAKTALSAARQKIAESLGCNPLEVIFTSGGSEANNLALFGVMGAIGRGGRLVIGGVEHPSIKQVASALAQRGVIVETIPVKRTGELDWDEYVRILNDSTKGQVNLVSMMLVNNESGTLFPIKKMARLARSVGALFHTDAVQGLGKVAFNLEHLGVDLASFSSHKFYALKGSGVLFCRKGVQLQPYLLGGPQERGRRAGTENILAISSFALQCGELGRITQETQRLQDLTQRLESRVQSEIGGVEIVGQKSKRVAGVSHFLFDGIFGETLLMNLDLLGVAVSTGAACGSGRVEPAGTLLAMGYSHREAQQGIRVSMGWETTELEIDLFFEALCLVVQRLRKLSSQRVDPTKEIFLETSLAHSEPETGV